MSPPVSEKTQTVESLSYRALQQKAGELGLKKSGKTDDLKHRIQLALEEQDGRIVTDYETDVVSDPDIRVTSPRSGRKKTQASPKSVVRSSRKRPATEGTSPTNGEQKRKRDSLASDAAADTQHGSSWVRALQHTPQRVSRFLTSASDSAKQSVSRLQLPDSVQDALGLSPQKKTPAKRGRKKKEKPTWTSKLRAALPGATTLLTLLVALLALTAFLTALNLAYRHRHDIADTVKAATHTTDQGLQHISRSAQRAGSRAWHTIGHLPQQLWDALPHAPSLRKPSWPRKQAAPVLLDLIPQQPQWAGVRDTIQSVMSGQPLIAHKATAVVLAGTEQSSRQAATRLGLNLMKGQAHCFLFLRGQSLSTGGAQAKGKLQHQLAHTLKGCPDAVVIVENLQKMHPGLLPIWINALSEQGSFVLDGEAVSSARATYIFTTAESKDLLALDTEEELSQAVKSSLVSSFGQAKDYPLQSGEAAAFRGRLDVVAPLLD